MYKQAIKFFPTSITEKTGLKYNNLMVLSQCIESKSINVLNIIPLTLTKSMLIVTQSLRFFDETGTKPQPVSKLSGEGLP